MPILRQLEELGTLSLEVALRFVVPLLNFTLNPLKLKSGNEFEVATVIVILIAES